MRSGLRREVAGGSVAFWDRGEQGETHQTSMLRAGLAAETSLGRANITYCFGTPTRTDGAESLVLPIVSELTDIFFNKHGFGA